MTSSIVGQGSNRQSMTLEEAVKKYILQVSDEVLPKTIKDKQRELGWFCVIKKNLEDIIIDDIKLFILNLDKSDIRKWRVKITLRAFFKWANEMGYSTMPYTLIRNKEPVFGRREAVTDEDFKLLDDTCHSIMGNDRVFIRWHAFLHFLYETGLRRHEALHLLLQDINYNEKTFKIKCAKSNRIRTGFYITPLDNYLKAYPINKRRRFLFPISNREANHIITKLCELSGIKKKITPHCFRHGYVTRLLENGCSIQDAAILAGHIKIDTTMRYFHNVDLKNKYEQYFNRPKIIKIDSLVGIKQKYRLEIKLTKRK